LFLLASGGSLTIFGAPWLATMSLQSLSVYSHDLFPVYVSGMDLDPPIYASQVAGITGVCHHSQPKISSFSKDISLIRLGLMLTVSF
jgi:hypothetical protein